MVTGRTQGGLGLTPLSLMLQKFYHLRKRD